MEAKETARELYNRYLNILPDAVEISQDAVKDCALIAADTVLGETCAADTIEYWEEVKKEIEALTP